MRPDESMKELVARFSDPAAVARYPEGPAQFVPGYAELHRMTGILLAERAPQNAQVLVLGAGGGLELKALAQAYPGWTFVGIDPAAEMLKLAERTLGSLAERVQLREGYIDDAPHGPFDAATCLLTLHFLDAAERQRTVGEIRRRLKPGAPFVAAHASCPRGQDERARWLSRYTAFGIASGADLNMPTTLARRSKPSSTSSCSVPKRMLQSCVVPASRISSCSTPPSLGAAGWVTPEARRRAHHPEKHVLGLDPGIAAGIRATR